jgi:hypothetical protein
MNNSDHNDFNNWQNGDDSDMNNPNNGFFFYGKMNPEFKKMWDQIQNGEDFTQSMRDYLNIDDIMRDFGKMPPQPNKQPRRPIRNKPKHSPLTQDEYLKLIEIRGYLAIQEQHAHVKALDKLLNQIVIFPKGNQ